MIDHILLSSTLSLSPQSKQILKHNEFNNYFNTFNFWNENKAQIWCNIRFADNCTYVITRWYLIGQECIDPLWWINKLISQVN